MQFSDNYYNTDLLLTENLSSIFNFRSFLLGFLNRGSFPIPENLLSAILVQTFIVQYRANSTLTVQAIISCLKKSCGDWGLTTFPVYIVHILSFNILNKVNNLSILESSPGRIPGESAYAKANMGTSQLLAFTGARGRDITMYFQDFVNFLFALFCLKSLDNVTIAWFLNCFLAAS